MQDMQIQEGGVLYFCLGDTFCRIQGRLFRLTVAERDKALLTFKEEMQNYLNGLSEEEIAGSDIKKMLKTKSAELAAGLSAENMKLSPCDIYMIEIYNAGTEITK